MIILQNFVFPEKALNAARGLYFQSDGKVGFSRKDAAVTLQSGAVLRFCTYFNLFNVTKWQAACNLEGLFLDVSGRGAFDMTVKRALTPADRETVEHRVVTLKQGVDERLDLSSVLQDGRGGIVYLELTAMQDDACFKAARFSTTTPLPQDTPRLAVSITTYRREKQVLDTLARLQPWRAGFVYGDQIRVQVVDNGQSVDLAPGDPTTLYHNPNYGGSGGFARGLLEAEKDGFTHCLFMDDDASFHMENIARAYVFLMLAKDGSTALAGAMISNLKPWQLWENGARFDEVCRALFYEIDLRDTAAVLEMELTVIHSNRDTIYGAWWFFAFAISEVRHYPFPFFVRGDDISFGLMNDFDVCTLNGVVSFQDDFAEKESPLTLYLDLRHSLVQHLVSPQLHRSGLKTAKVAFRFVARSLFRFHYDSARALLMAWQDVMAGPEFFDQHIDMVARRAEVNALLDVEAWQPHDGTVVTEKRRLTLKSKSARRLLCILTMNGHLVPFSRSRWDRVAVPIEERSNAHQSFGAAEVTYLDASGTRRYTVVQSKRQFFLLAGRSLVLTGQFLFGFRKLRQRYQDGYDRLTSRAYWEEKAR